MTRIIENLHPQEAIELAVKEGRVIHFSFYGSNEDVKIAIKNAMGCLVGRSGVSDNALCFIPSSVCAFHYRPAWMPLSLWDFLVLHCPLLLLSHRELRRAMILSFRRTRCRILQTYKR